MQLKSFLGIAPDSIFPIQNLPYGIFSYENGREPRAGVAIGDWVLDLSVIEARGLFADIFSEGSEFFSQPTLNAFMAAGHEVWLQVRERIQDLLSEHNRLLQDDDRLRRLALIPRPSVQLYLPAHIGDYTDFYSSQHHAANVGAMFRDKDNPLLPNWKHLPVAYHGRSSSVVLSGTSIRRPRGQILPPGSNQPVFEPTDELDFELELGMFIGPGNELGHPIPIKEAEKQIFGLVLVNDWSARDIQRWEYKPLGPFLGKNFATSISPWIVPLQALDPFRCAGPEQQPKPLPYLATEGNLALDIELEVAWQSSGMDEDVVISRTNARHLYWSFSQQIAHHSATGCNLRPGDLLASGTISGAEEGSYGSLLELTWGGERPLQLPGGQTRTYLADGDRLTLRGYCQGDGFRVGFGEVNGVIIAA